MSKTIEIDYTMFRNLLEASSEDLELLVQYIVMIQMFTRI